MPMPLRLPAPRAAFATLLVVVPVAAPSRAGSGNEASRLPATRAYALAASAVFNEVFKAGPPVSPLSCLEIIADRPSPLPSVNALAICWSYISRNIWFWPGNIGSPELASRMLLTSICAN